MDNLIQAKQYLCAFAIELEDAGMLIAPEALRALKHLRCAKESEILPGIAELATQLETFVSVKPPEPEYGCGDDFPLVQAEVVADDTICSYLMDCRPWLIQQDDDDFYRLLENDGGPNELTDGIHYEFGYRTEGGRKLDGYLEGVNPEGNPKVGFSVEVNVDQLAEWLREFRPTVIEEWEHFHA